jgi:ATP-dependent DNA helicase RecG
MTKEELCELISLGEGQTLEFKRSISDDFGREMVAFANSLGGTLLIGVDDKGVVIGADTSNRAKAQIQNTARNLEPPLHVEVEAVDNVIAITIPESDDRPHASGGRFYLREGATCQQMTRSQIRDFFFKEGLIHFDAMPNAAFNIPRDLAKNRYREFARSANIPLKLDMFDALTNLKLTAEKRMTNAGALLLGKEGSRYLISATITCALFQGKTKTKILDQKIFDGDIYSNFNNALLYLQSHLNTEYIIKIKRTEKLELPEDALREALINAIAHRDYRSTANIQIYIFYDRVEIHNPGGLVAGMKLSDLGHRSVPRNPLLFGMLYRMDLVENVGSGLKRIRDTMKENGLDEPVIEADEHWFTVTFHRERAGRPTSAPDVEEPATRVKTSMKTRVKTGKKILGIIKENPNVTRVEIAELTGISLKGIDWQLSRMKTLGRLKRIGPDKGGYWEVD